MLRPLSNKMLLPPVIKKEPAQMNARELLALTTCKEKVSISFKPSESEPAIILFPEYPLDLAKAFSGFATANIRVKEVPSFVALPRIVPHGKSTVTIVGGASEPAKILKTDMSRIQQVFRWIRAYAGGDKDLPSVEKKHPIFEYLRLLDVAEELEVPLLSAALLAKITVLCSKNLQLTDVEAVTDFYCRGEEKWQIVLEACAQAVSRGLISEADPKLKTIMEAHGAFGGALKERVEKLELLEMKRRVAQGSN